MKRNISELAGALAKANYKDEITRFKLHVVTLGIPENVVVPEEPKDLVPGCLLLLMRIKS